MNQYDLWGQMARQHPHTFYARLRDEQPICRLISPRTGNVVWLITRYDDVQSVLKDPLFIKDPSYFASPTRVEEGSISPTPSLNQHLLTLDPPDHTRLRMLVQSAFTPKMITGLEPYIRAKAESLIAAMLPKSKVDLIEDFALPLPTKVIAEMLGIPPEDHMQFRVWMHKLFFLHDSHGATLAAMQCLRYFKYIIEERRKEPRNDLITALLHVEEQGQQLSPQEMISMLFLLLLAGFETTVGLISSGVMTLLQHPDQLECLRQQPALIGSAIEEMLRFESPLENTLTRFAARETNWRGFTMQAGDVVLASLLSANRDPAHFSEPDQFDITRDPNKHLAFGYGIHYCLGGPLARFVGGIAISTLIDRIPTLALALPPDQLEWADHIQFHSLKALPVKF